MSATAAAPVTVTLPDGSKKTFDAPVTALGVAEAIGPGLAKAALAAVVNGRTVDLATVIDADATIAILTAKQPEGLEVLRHSCTHLMAQAVKRLWPNAMLEDGPPTEDGYWYDIRTVPAITPDDFERIEAEMQKIVEERLPIARRVLTRDEARALFGERGEKYKLDLIERIPEGDTISTYQQGEFIDLCRGPHVPNTGVIGSFKLLSVAGAYWKGDAKNDQLTRIRGTVFADKKQLKEWLTIQEEAKKRDHRKIGRELGLIMYHEWAPGETFWLPKGKVLYDVLKSMASRMHREEGYVEVFTPMLFKKDLFETSGHWSHYRDNMFIVPGQEAGPLSPEQAVLILARVRERIADYPEKAAIEAILAQKINDPVEQVREILAASKLARDRFWQVFEKKPGELTALLGDEQNTYALKAMNCPSHMLVFRDVRRSYRELPMRIHDQGVLHRNEASGTLSGLTRVRQFCQDDAHLFVTDEQIEPEISAVIAMAKRVYAAVGMEFSQVFLSTRPEKALGSKEQWDQAEEALRQAIEKNGLAYTVNEGDGAFYGPKIDFMVRDALRREFQVATIQLDYQLPSRFGLRYTAADGSERMPIVVHRAIFGSFERFIGILIEHFAGAFPTWLAPEQVRVLSISEKYVDYARKVRDALRKRDVRAEADLGDDKIGAKIREAQLAKVPYMLVVGEKEEATGSVAVRSREKGDEGTATLETFFARIDGEKARVF